MGFYAVLRISSLPIPLVNLTDLCKKFGTRWHMCAKTCAKSSIFQICLYETILNVNNLNYIYNFHKFKLLPFFSVLLSSIWACCSYFPMQHIYTIDWKRFSLLIGTTRIFTMTRKILTNSSCWKSAISTYVLYRAFLAHFQVSVDTKLKWFLFSLLPHLRSKWFTDAKVRFFLRIIANHC